MLRLRPSGLAQPRSPSLSGCMKLASSSKDPHSVLGVGPGASEKEVKAAYLEQSKRLHPDTSDAPDAKEKFSELTSAYEALKSGSSAASRPGQSGPQRWKVEYTDLSDRHRFRQTAAREEFRRKYGPPPGQKADYDARWTGYQEELKKEWGRERPRSSHAWSSEYQRDTDDFLRARARRASRQSSSDFYSRKPWTRERRGFRMSAPISGLAFFFILFSPILALYAHLKMSLASRSPWQVADDQRRANYARSRYDWYFRDLAEAERRAFGGRYPSGVRPSEVSQDPNFKEDLFSEWRFQQMVERRCEGDPAQISDEDKSICVEARQHPIARKAQKPPDSNAP